MPKKLIEFWDLATGARIEREAVFLRDLRAAAGGRDKDRYSRHEPTAQELRDYQAAHPEVMAAVEEARARLREAFA